MLVLIVFNRFVKYDDFFSSNMNKNGYEANTKLIKNWGGKSMDVMRVKQILSSSAEIDVKYHGASVWIDQLNEDGRTATVHLRGPLEERSTVDISDLSEG